MLAEKIFNTKAQSPVDLINRMVEIGDEVAWTAPDALYLVEWLSSHDRIIYGIELVRELAGKFQWIATSQPFSEAPETNQSEASEFLREFQDFDSHPRNLFIMTWGMHPAI